MAQYETSNSFNQSASFSSTYTTQGVNRIMFVAIRVLSGELAKINTPTYAGQSFTLITNANNTPDNQYAWAYYVLVNPALGSNTLSVTFNTTINANADVIAIQYSGFAIANQPDATGPQSAINAGPTTFSTAVTVAHGNCWVMGVGVGNINGTGASTTSHVAASSKLWFGDSNGRVPIGSQQLNWTSPGSGACAGIAIAIMENPNAGLLILL